MTFKKLVALTSLMLVVAGCSVAPTNDSTSSTSSSAVATDKIQVQVEIMVQGQLVAEHTKTIEVDKGEDVLDAMKANYNVEETKGLITEIAEIESDKGENKGRYWKLLVNGEMSQVGAADVALKQGDKVTFDLTSEW